MPKRGKLILISGGVRSGKSRLAEKLAAAGSDSVVYIATCVPGDPEMLARVADHRQHRPQNWITLEENLNPARIIREKDGPDQVFLLECLTLLISNLLLYHGQEHQAVILDIIRELARVSSESQASVIIVSNEVGAGIVPADPVSRAFRDLMGQANRIIAAQADQVYLCLAGMPVEIKNLSIR